MSAQTKTRNVVLVTADGLRWQELFRGMDPLLMHEKSAGMEKAEQARKKYWRETAGERRAVLMPFVWTTLARRGVILGNPDRNSSVTVTNAFRVSYPGYSEILTGRAQDDRIRGNDKIQNPSLTVLEYVRDKLRLTTKQVAVFGSWETFRYIVESRPGSIFVNAGYHEADGSARMRELSALQFSMLTPEHEVRHDYVTLEMALDYMAREKPRVTYIALGETDDWAHGRRYDRVLDMAHYFDSALRQIAEFADRDPHYRGSTTIIITSDHGRGSAVEDWHGHGAKVAGAERIWAAMLGPDTPAGGEAKDTAPVHQRDIAATILDLLGLDYREYKGNLGRPIPAAR